MTLISALYVEDWVSSMMSSGVGIATAYCAMSVHWMMMVDVLYVQRAQQIGGSEVRLWGAYGYTRR